jgi:hypothetical protein
MAERDLHQLRRISSALDGDGPMPHPLDDDGRDFLAAAQRLRSMARLEEAAVPPDVTDAVLRQVHAGPAAAPRLHAPHRLALVAAAVFAIAGVAAALLVRDGGPLAPEAVLADVGDELLAAQTAVLALEAEVTIVERGAHPVVPVRRYSGALRYEAPERLWLHLEERTDLPVGWPANNSDVVIDEQVAWSSGLRDCPVGEQPGCLRADTRIVTGASPFSADHVGPLDLIVPAGAFLPTAEVSSTEDGHALVLDTTVARVQGAIDGLRGAGALRAVHPTDPVRLELDASTFTIRRLTVLAGPAPSRVTWAATNGYTETPGTEILDVRLRRREVADAPFPSLPSAPGRSAGFDDGLEAVGPTPSYLPSGYEAHRDGVMVTSGPDVNVRTWSNGRAWIRLDATQDPTGDMLLGAIGPVARPVAVGDGVGYTDPLGHVVSLHTDELEVAVSGSVPLDTLLRVAASLPLDGRALPRGWAQSGALEELPDGALSSGSPLIARYDGDDLVLVVPGPGSTSAVLRQRPGDRLAPPSPDAVAASVRGIDGRYDPVSSRLEWVEDGWVRSLQSEGRALEALQELAARLERA